MEEQEVAEDEREIWAEVIKELKPALKFEGVHAWFDGAEFRYEEEEHEFKLGEGNSNIVYVPFEGRIDQSSFEIILAHCRPRQLLLLSNKEEMGNKVRKFIEDSWLETKVQ